MSSMVVYQKAVKLDHYRAVQKTHSDNKHAQDYIKLIDFIFN